MKLDELLAPWVSSSMPTIEITSLSNDSRTIEPGALFLAYPGHSTDGRKFIPHAFEKGASALVYEQNNFPADIELPEKLICIPVTGLAQHTAHIAARFYGYKEKSLNLTGVTGTNGKTTIAWLLSQAFNLLGEPAAYIGTLGQGIKDKIYPLPNTTPDALCLHKLFADFQHQNIQRVAMEVSSHALDQGRVSGLRFKQAIFTNLTHDHLDYHRTFEAYAQAKSKLFMVDGLEQAIINLDDPYAGKMLAAVQSGCEVVTYGFHSNADVRALDLTMDERGVFANIESPWGKFSLQLSLIGQFNLYNALAVFSTLVSSGYKAETVVKVLSQLQAAPGRMEIITHQPLIVVDFAHSPDALKNVLSTLKQLKKGRLLLVFGCGGERDHEKRPLMGKVAGEFADEIFVTSDNPRNEDPDKILDEIISGINSQKGFYRISDRKEAIHRAIESAKEEDTVLIAGKGHEAYQIIGNKTFAFSDQAIARELLRNRTIVQE